MQLRQKKWSARKVWDLLGEVERRIPSDALARMLVNDRCDVALCARAIGVHLPESGMPVEIARRLLGRERLIGVSCHDEGRLAEVWSSGADFATIGPVFATPGKGPPMGLDAVRRLRIPNGMPVFGLGGLDEGNAGELAGSGLHGIACIRSVFGAADPVLAAQALERRFLGT